MRRMVKVIPVILVLIISLQASESYHRAMIFYDDYSQVKELIKSPDIDVVHRYSRFSKHLDVIIRPSYLDKIKRAGVKIKVTCENIEQPRDVILRKDKGGPFGYYPLLEEIDSIIQDLESRFPAIVKIDSLSPRTVLFNYIYLVKISNSPDADNKRPEALITGAMHANEPIGVACTKNDMRYLCENYSTDPEVKWLVDNRQIYIIPVMNPDRYLWNENYSVSNRRRKNMNIASGVSQSQGGVDPNRNYPYKWGYDDQWSSPDPSSNFYRGESPVSEPETEAMINFIHAHKIRTWQNHHSDRDVLVIPFGYDYRVSLGSDSIVYHTMCEEQQAEYGRFKKWGPSYLAYDGFALNGGTEDWSWSDSATYRMYCVITELGESMWESDAAARVTTEKMLGADLYMVKCAGFYPVLKNITIEDDVAGNNDGVLNPGETVKFFAEIENKSVVDTTPDVKGVLSSSYSHIDMRDANADYGDIKLLETFENSSSDAFEFKCGSQAQEGDWAKFDLKLTWTMNSVDFEKTLACSLQVGRLVGIVHDYQVPGLDAGLRIIQNNDKQSVRFKLVVPQQNLINYNNTKLKIGIFNASGREVRSIDYSINKSSNLIDWNMTDNSGKKITGGVYFMRVNINDFNVVQKFIVMR